MASAWAEALESLFMSIVASLVLLLSVWTGQSEDRPAYAREGDRVEQEFRAYRDRLNQFFMSLRSLIEQQPSAASTLPRLQLQDAPPSTAARFGFGMLPRIVDTPPAVVPPVSAFSYSWPITEGYLA